VEHIRFEHQVVDASCFIDSMKSTVSCIVIRKSVLIRHCGLQQIARPLPLAYVASSPTVCRKWSSASAREAIMLARPRKAAIDESTPPLAGQVKHRLVPARSPFCGRRHPLWQMYNPSSMPIGDGTDRHDLQARRSRSYA